MLRLFEEIVAEIGGGYQQGEPDQAFDKEKQKTGDAEAFQPFIKRICFFFRLLRYHHHHKNNFFARIFQTIYFPVRMNYEKTFFEIYGRRFLFYSFFVLELSAVRAAAGTKQT